MRDTSSTTYIDNMNYSFKSQVIENWERDPFTLRQQLILKDFFYNFFFPKKVFRIL